MVYSTLILWTCGESDPGLDHAMITCYRYTTVPLEHLQLPRHDLLVLFKTDILLLMHHSIETSKKVQELRKTGHSISELMALLSLPKTTVWHYIQGIKIQRKYIKKWRSKQGGSHKRSEEAWEKAMTEAESILSDQNRSYWASVLAMLYWAEGNKKEFTFTNTNPEMLDLVIRILSNLFETKRKDLIVTVRYFTGMDEKTCRNHWSNITGCPSDQIRMRLNDGGTTGRSPFGICRLRIRKSGNIFKIIQCLIKKVPNNLPLSFNG